MEFKEMKEFKPFTEMLSRCYPMMELTTAEDKEEAAKHRERTSQYETVTPMGVYEEGTLKAGYIHYMFPMNVYGQTMPSTGVGTLAVDLPYKKQGLAKQMISYAIEKSRNEGFPLIQLYPFRPDFYRKMGFGFGPQLNVFRFSPYQAPSFTDAAPVVSLGKEDVEEIKRCYHDWAEDTHGACDKQDYEFSHIAMDYTHTIGCRIDGKLQGYAVYEMKHHHDFTHDLKVIDWFTNSNEAFQAIINFLHLQKDQVSTIIFPTFDDDFAFMLNDPRHDANRLIHRIYHQTHERGTGLMYRIIDVPLFMEYIRDHSFRPQTNAAINFDITDSLLKKKEIFSYQFKNGRPEYSDTPLSHGVTLALSIDDLSSLLMGAVSLKKLLSYNKASASGNEEELKKAVHLFNEPEKPVSWTFF
ncbi:enhanced intracellular survival protein Eis [Halobacillus sp. A5]|uniref:GNAT family N-acetyltransferase n=1 Tax=Halobacillus sp. A5 TaxID=2880263 RepID=UPI0020A650BA|nr:GNAT family N-acetyltransferase [Halobacillus sp. A5]MCP3027514.1 GNAT family N-acetyltransferase [Halobacillus sp. A5]